MCLLFPGPGREETSGRSNRWQTETQEDWLQQRGSPGSAGTWAWSLVLKPHPEKPRHISGQAPLLADRVHALMVFNSVLVWGGCVSVAWRECLLRDHTPVRDHPEERSYPEERPYPDERLFIPRWETTLVRDYPDGRPSWWETIPQWETTLMRGQPDEKLPWWRTTLLRDHTLMRGYTPGRDHPEERPPWWETISW